MSTLAQLRDRVEVVLVDSGNLIWSTDAIDEGIRQALEEYSRTLPLLKSDTLTLGAAGREIDLSSLTGLLDVTRVYWPYDASAETWPPNRVKGWRLTLLDGDTPTLELTGWDQAQPQAGDVVRLWYTAMQTIDGLDSADASTVRQDHESLLVVGAAGKCALFRAADLIEIAGTDLYQVGLLNSWGKNKLKEFMYTLEMIRSREAVRGVPWVSGWPLDKWGQ